MLSVEKYPCTCITSIFLSFFKKYIGDDSVRKGALIKHTFLRVLALKKYFSSFENRKHIVKMRKTFLCFCVIINQNWTHLISNNNVLWLFLYLFYHDKSSNIFIYFHRRIDSILWIMLKRMISFDNGTNQMLIIQNKRELQKLIYLKRGRGNTAYGKNDCF